MMVPTKNETMTASAPNDGVAPVRLMPGMPGFDGLVPGSLSDTVTSYLRAAVVRCEIQPGERIQVKDIEQRLGVSHIPVREALRVLEGEGLIVNVPRRGAIAAPVSVEDLADLYDLRRMIEPEVAVRASHKMTLAHLSLLEQAADAVNNCDAHSAALIGADRAFHWTILQLGTTPLISRTLNQLWQAAERYVYIGMEKPTTAERRKEQHRDIIAAIREQDEPLIRTTYQHHLTLVEGVVRQIQLDED